jgi:hypothetical protein
LSDGLNPGECKILSQFPKTGEYRPRKGGFTRFVVSDMFAR